MKVLYIHGLDSQPNEERIKYMESLGHEVDALHLDYRNEPETYRILKELAQGNNIEYLVGSSFGGFLSFWLGEELGLPSLLFNPAMHVSPEQAYFKAPNERKSPKRRVVIGGLDDVVDPQENWKFFEQEGNLALDQRVIMCQWLGHQIDQDTFIDACSWARL
ncbi:MAG: hypothetical protein MRZ79_18465 [Bacteroidia bacterium]|nr:hypothetical protein [Bacteroidia bacterium]